MLISIIKWCCLCFLFLFLKNRRSTHTHFLFDLILAENRLTFIYTSFHLPFAKWIHFISLHCNGFFFSVRTFFLSPLWEVSVPGHLTKLCFWNEGLCSLKKSAFNLKWFKWFTDIYKLKNFVCFFLFHKKSHQVII